MAIQFPPIAVGDPAPVDGQSYLYLVTQEEFIYTAEDNSWAPQGKSDGNAFGYSGTVFVRVPAPTDAEIGNIYSVADGAPAAEVDPSFTGLAGQYDVDQWNLVIYDGTNWQLISTPAGPWVRTVGGRIQPIIQTDDLDMVDGNYVIESLPELPLD